MHFPQKNCLICSFHPILASMNILHISHHFSQTLKKERIFIFVRPMTYDNSNPPTIGLHLHCMIFHPSCDAQINGVDPSSKNLKKIRTIKVGYKYI
jgi:hypothetical protein